MSASIELFGQMSLPPRWKEPLYRSLANRIRAAISSGELQAGDLLPREEDIAGALHVSVGTVAHAVNLLVRDRFLAAPRGARVRVLGDATPRKPSSERNPPQRLRSIVQSVERGGSGVQVRVTVEPGQELVISTTESAVEWLELKPGESAEINLSNPNLVTGAS